jgi:transcription-repair coupling factor (superfamily II helicase)
MKISEFLKVYKNDGLVQTIAEAIKPNENNSVRLKGLTGSLDAILAAAIYGINHQNHLFVLHDKEEAAYFFNDLQSLLGPKEVLFFPTSYKRPYEFDETENANILQRAEILNRINHKATSGELIVTYPEALTERVINKKSLTENTFTASTGDNVDIEFLAEVLNTYDFEKTDFVYEAGQYAIRGGIVDVFSYAHDLPYRLEFFGNEIESIRTFDPANQLSVEPQTEINIIPNVQTRLIGAGRQSFLKFLPRNTKIWFKDVQLTEDTINQYFTRASQSFSQVIEAANQTQVVLQPEDLFETVESFKAAAGNFCRVEFGNRFTAGQAVGFEFASQPQPSFHKDFELLKESLDQNEMQGIANFIVAESPKQIERLQTIFEEIDPQLNFQSLNIGLRGGFIDHQVAIACYTDHQIFERFHRFKVKSSYSRSQALTLKELQTLQTGDYVTHIDHGIGRFAGLVKVDTPGAKQRGNLQEAVRLIYKDDDILYVNIHSIHKISKYSGKEGVAPAMSKLGSQEWENKKKRAKKKVVDIARDLINLYAKRKQAPGFRYSPDSFLQAELESSFLFEDTPDQASATAAVKDDMEQEHPMDRLVCGDVGFGKTEVAIRAAFKAVTDNRQVAVLVPTTILAMQHYRTFSDRLASFPVNVEYINRFKSSASIKQTLGRVASGETEILIGTHRLVNKDVKFKNLGLMIIDEEQKFGVKVKEKLKQMRINVDALTLTATPIPRTLHFSLMGARDLSIISTPPPNRQPVTTELHVFNETILRDAIAFELRRGGQVFFVHNRIRDIEEIGNIVLKLVPDARIGIAHGQMEGTRLEKAMLRFVEGEYDVLVSTNIIESGLDIPNANTIIINQAHMFGLSELHQMRGRVGRSNRKAFCYLLSPPTIGLSTEARKRLSTLEEFSELGDGFKVAMRDLDIRGAGNLLGAEQSGFISDLGFDMYHKILDEAVQELKESEFKELFEHELSKSVSDLVKECIIESDLELIIPEDFVENITERLSLYTQLDNIKEESKLAEFSNSLQDRFGPLPETVLELLESVRLRWQAETLGFEKLILKNGNLRAYFVPQNKEGYYKGEIFGQILKFIQSSPRRCRMKELKGKLLLSVDEIESVKEARNILAAMTHNS